MNWDWTQVSRSIGEHSTHSANKPVKKKKKKVKLQVNFIYFLLLIFFNIPNSVNLDLVMNEGIL